MKRRATSGETENDLVARAHGGDIDAFEALTRLHVRSVLRYSASVVTDRGSVKDVAQEVLLVA